MKISKKIPKRILWRIAIFAAVIGAAFVFDSFFGNEQVATKTTESNSDFPDSGFNHVYLLVQTNPVTVKSLVQKTDDKRDFLKSHDKFIQKYHQLRNFQVLKAEVEKQTAPLILSYHYLVFKKILFSLPDDDNPLS